jgi:outer membrane protein assembly factor BamB
MKIKTLISLFILFIGCSQIVGCAHINNINNGAITKKRFDIQARWIKSLDNEDLLSFRKIHRFTPILFKDLVIQGNAFDKLSARRQVSGEEIWSLNIANGIESSGVLANKKIYFAALDGLVYSVDPEDGKVAWTFNTKMENLSQPLVAEGKVFVLSGANTLFALDAETGKQKWLYNRQDSSSLSIRGGSKPVLHKGVLYTGFSDGALVALDSSSGSLKWEKILNTNKKFRDLDFDPVVDEEKLYVGGFDDHLYVINLNSGDILWKYNAGVYGGLLVSGKLLYFGTTQGEFLAVQKEDGQKVWKESLENRGIATTPIFHRGMVIYGESLGKLKFLDALTGKNIGSYEPGRGVFAAPVIKENKLFFVSNEGLLYCLEFGWNSKSSIPWLEASPATPKSSTVK